MEYTPHDGDVTYSDCSTSHRQNHQKCPNVFGGGEHLLQNGILNFVFRLSQSSGIVLES